MSSTRTAASLLLVLISLGLLARAQAQDPSDAERVLQEGIAALHAQRWDDAEARLNAAANASAEAAPGVAARAEFYLGSLYQTRSTDDPDATTRRNDLLAAAAHYEKALQGLPRSGPTLNNLARVRGELGDAVAASQLLDRALALEDGKEAAYLRTRAELSDRRAAPAAERVAHWQAAFNAAPQDESARRAFVQLALQADPAALGKMAQSLIERGSVQAGEELLRDALTSPAAPRASLMLSLADARAAQYYDPRSFDGTDIAAVLRGLEADPDIGAAAQEFRRLHMAPSPDRAAYPWWTRDYSDYAPPNPRGRETSFRRLALALGDWYRAQGSAEALRQAQPYAELALALSGNIADPKAALQLADIYANTGQTDRLKTMSNEYSRKLFAGKGGAYQSGDKQQIYEYHLALGSIFGYLGQWENPQWAPASAIFQLEHARSTAESLNASLPAASKQRITVPAPAVELLSRGYLATGRPDESVKVRVDSARQYAAQGKPALQAAVLQSPEGAVAVAKSQRPETQANWNAALMSAQLPVVEPPHSRMGPLEVGVDRQGGDLGPGFQVADAAECSGRCAANEDCRAMTFVKHADAAGGVCWLKGSVPAQSAHPAMTSAVKQ